MSKEVIHTDKVPPAKVPLSQAIKVGDMVYLSGQLENDSATGMLVPGGIGPETRQVCENMKAVLEAAGSSLEKAVKVTIFMADLSEMIEMNSVFNEYFPENPPARTTLAVKELVAGARVEIEVAAFI